MFNITLDQLDTLINSLDIIKVEGDRYLLNQALTVQGELKKVKEYNLTICYFTGYDADISLSVELVKHLTQLKVEYVAYQQIHRK